MVSFYRAAVLVSLAPGAGCEQCKPVVEIYSVAVRPQRAPVTRPAPRRALAIPVAVERAFERRAQAAFSWIRVMSRPVIQFCEIRVALGTSAWALGRRHRVPLWVLERLNRGRDLSRLRAGRSLRVPAARNSLAADCFTPVRGWRDRPDSKPPFYW